MKWIDSKPSGIVQLGNFPFYLLLLIHLITFWLPSTVANSHNIKHSIKCSLGLWLCNFIVRKNLLQKCVKPA